MTDVGLCRKRCSTLVSTFLRQGPLAKWICCEGGGESASFLERRGNGRLSARLVLCGVQIGHLHLYYSKTRYTIHRTHLASGE